MKLYNVKYRPKCFKMSSSITAEFDTAKERNEHIKWLKETGAVILRKGKRTLR